MPRGKQTGGYQNPAWLCKIERRHTILRIPSRRNKKCGAGVYIEKLQESFKILAGLTEKMVESLFKEIVAEHLKLM